MSDQFAVNRRSVIKAVAGGVGLAAMGGLARPAIAQGAEITIISSETNPAAVSALRAVAEAFKSQGGSTVVINNMDMEANKTAIRNYLVAGAPDLCFWFSGNRMRAFVERGLFTDISDLFAARKYADVLGPTTDSVTVEGKQYGLPTGGTLWGMFYRRDVFAEHGLTVPGTWDEFIAYGQKAKAAGLIPVAIGTKELWPAAGWFDQMNLRINGLEKHMALMNGQMSYTDPALTPVFDRWKQLIDAGFFTPNSTSFGWQEAGAALAQKKAGMMNLGAFVRATFRPEEVDQLAFAPFPVIDPAVGRFEDFSLNSVHIPSGAKNKEGAKEFLAYWYTPENLAPYLEPQGNVPPRNDMPQSSDPLVNDAVAVLKETEGTAQYYDRDTDPDMAQAGLAGFQEFMAKPERRDAILKRLEATRKRIYKS